MEMVDVMNRVGSWFVDYSFSMLWQCSLLVVLLYLIDMILKDRTRAIVRYGLWMLVMVKLVLPAGIAMPSSPLYWVKADNAVESRAVYEDAAEEVDVFTEPLFVSVDTLPEPEAAAVQGKEMVSDSAKEMSAAKVFEKSINFEAMLMIVWLMAVLVMAGMLLQRYGFVMSLIRQGHDCDDRLKGILERCRTKIDVASCVRIRLSDNSISPSVCGLFRPVILMPAEMAGELSDSQLEAVLLHELAHIRRKDLWVNFLQTVLQVVYFYNPLLWFANSQIRTIREQAVDEAVLVAMQGSAEEYPEVLLKVSKLTWQKPMLSLRLVGVVESKSALASRIRHMLNRPLPGKAGIGLLGGLFIIVCGAILLPMAQGQGKEPDFVIHGRVTDAATGHPIAGVHVGDAGSYNNGLFFDTTDVEGYYSYKSWYEEHNITAKADGYKTAGSLLTTNIFDPPSENEVNFVLSQAEKTTGVISDLQAKAKKYVETFFDNNFRDVTKRTDISWSEPVINEAGNIVIDYKYEASIWDKYTIISNQRFEYTQGGEFVKYSDLISVDDFDSVKNQVTKFFNNNYRDITSRKDIEWGKPYVDDAGNIRLMYKYEATIWDKDKIEQTKEFVFSPEGKFIKVVDYYEPGTQGEVQKAIKASKSGSAVIRSTGSNPKNNFEAELSNGVVIKILGVCTNPSVGKDWWMPDGSVSGVRSDKVYGSNVSSSGVPYEIMYEIDGLTNDMSVTYSASGCSATGHESEQKGSAYEGVLTMYMDKGVTNTSVAIGIAGGEWEKLTSFGKNSSRGAFGVNGDSFMYGEIVEVGNKVRISVSYSVADRPIRLAAIGKNGKEYIGESRGSTSMSGMTMGEYEFAGLSKDDIDEFEFQTRKYEWADFNNISLRAGMDMGFSCGKRLSNRAKGIEAQDWPVNKSNVLGRWDMASHSNDDNADIRSCYIVFNSNGSGSMFVDDGGDENFYKFSYYYKEDNKVVAEFDMGKLISMECGFDDSELIALVGDVVTKFKRQRSAGVSQDVPAGLQSVVSAFCRAAAKDDLDGVLKCFDPNGEDYSDVKKIMTAEENTSMYDMKKMFLAIDPDMGLKIISVEEENGKTKVIWRVKFASAFEVQGQKFEKGSTFDLDATVVKADDGRWLIDSL